MTAHILQEGKIGILEQIRDCRGVIQGLRYIIQRQSAVPKARTVSAVRGNISGVKYGYIDFDTSRRCTGDGDAIRGDLQAFRKFVGKLSHEAFYAAGSGGHDGLVVGV